MIATGNHFHFDSLRDAPPSLNVRILSVMIGVKSQIFPKKSSAQLLKV